MKIELLMLIFEGSVLMITPTTSAQEQKIAVSPMPSLLTSTEAKLISSMPWVPLK